MPRWPLEVSEKGSPEAMEVAGSSGLVALNSWVLRGRETEVSVGTQQAAGPLPRKVLPQGAGQPAWPAAAFIPGAVRLLLTYRAGSLFTHKTTKLPAKM